MGTDTDERTYKLARCLYERLNNVPCSYDSLKNISTSDVKKNPYSAWQRHESRNRAFLAVADELVRQMQELKVA
ncbi:MAG: hypothetical protein E7080_10820 [Bacteroidales bacterium]|nr:hypothetical protein [Bacteroidales bacterium]